jgi:hypothetical protein
MSAVKLHATTILGAFEEAQTELIGKAVGLGGTVESVWLDETHVPRLKQKLRMWFHIRCLSTRVRRRARLIDLRFQISRFLNQEGGKLRVGSCLGELENRRRLTHEIIPAYHDVPRALVSPAQIHHAGTGNLVPCGCIKVNTWNFARGGSTEGTRKGSERTRSRLTQGGLAPRFKCSHARTHPAPIRRPPP